MNILEAYKRRLLNELAVELLPVTESLPETPEALNLTDRILHHLTFLSKNLRFIFWLSLLVWRGGGFLFRGKFCPYPVRLMFQLLKSTVYVNYYSHPAVNQRIGFVPPPAQPRTQPLNLPEIPKDDVYLKTDVCVIGSGAGGAVVAKELAEKGRSVVILEEGAYFHVSDFGKEPLEITQKIYRNAGLQVTLGLPSIILPTGRAVGGTTIINSGTCFRLPERVFERWQSEQGLSDLTPNALSPYFDKVEHQLSVSPAQEDVLGNCAKIFRRGLEKMGLSGEPLHRNTKDCQGSGMCCFGCPVDAKQSVNLSYIPQALQKGAKLFTHCRVETIIPRQEHGGEVIGYFLDPLSGKKKNSIHVDAKVVVIAAGTLKTPYLLRKNQIASYNPHIGRHLTIHPASKLIGLFAEELRGWEGIPQGYAYYGMKEEGITFEGIFTPPSFGAINLDLPLLKHKEVMGQYSHLASFGFMVTDEGRGWIRWLPNGDPLIYYSIRLREVAKFVKGIRFLTEVFLNAGAREVYTGLPQLPIVTPAIGMKAFDGIKVHRRDLALAAFHPLGTCRMGVDPDRSVVNSFGEVHNYRNLFIADGSIFPTPLGVNPQETIMAFATRTAEFIDRERL